MRREFGKRGPRGGGRSGPRSASCVPSDPCCDPKKRTSSSASCVPSDPPKKRTSSCPAVLVDDPVPIEHLRHASIYKELRQQDAEMHAIAAKLAAARSEGEVLRNLIAEVPTPKPTPKKETVEAPELSELVNLVEASLSRPPKKQRPWSLLLLLGILAATLLSITRAPVVPPKPPVKEEVLVPPLKLNKMAPHVGRRNAGLKPKVHVEI